MKRKKILLIRLFSSSIKKTRHLRNPKPPLYFGYIAKLLHDQGDEYRFIDLMLKKNNLQSAINETFDYSPDYIIASCMSHDLNELIEYSKRIKKILNCILIAIGHYPTSNPEKFVYKGSPVDFCVLGEPELKVIELIRSLNLNEKKNKKKRPERIECVYSAEKKKRQICLVDLDTLPIPDHELFNPEDYTTIYPIPISKKVRWGYIYTSRGCPHQCIFCSPTIRESYGQKFRPRNPKKVIGEIKHLKSLGRNVISIKDDNFTTSKKHVISICDEMIRGKVKIDWIAQGRIDEVDESILKKMKQAGCINLRFGVESGSEKMLKVLKKTDNAKKWINQSKKVFEICKSLGLSATAFFQIGNPGEAEEDILASIRLAKELDPDMIQVAYFTPYPGSAAYKTYAKKCGDDLYHYSTPKVNLSKVSDERLTQLYDQFYRSFYFRPIKLLKQYVRFGGFYISNPKVWYNLLRMFI